MSAIPITGGGAHPGGGFGAHQPFTSTVHEYHSIFNAWIVVLTAIFFFIILSWYNVGLILYSRFVRDNLDDKEAESLNREILITTGYAIFWTLIGILVYYVLNRMELLGRGDRGVESEHPVVQDEAINVSGDTSLADIAI